MKKLLLLSGLFLTSLVNAQDPALQNGQFDRFQNSGGSNCACTHWINTDLGESATSTNTNLTTYALRLVPTNNNIAYQEVAVLANTNYKVTYHTRIGGNNTQAELRVLKGSGYKSGYTPTYYTDPATKPLSGFGYDTVASVEIPGNNIIVVTDDYPGNGDYNTYDFNFNSGSETSIALYLKRLGSFDVRFDWLTLTNLDALSVEDVFKSSLSVYPNPVNNDEITIKSKDIKIESVEVYNMLGKRVLKGSLVNDKINVSNLSSGIYMLKVNSGDSSSTRKIVKN